MEKESVYNLYNDGWQGLIVNDAFQHPAKFSRGLIYWIIKTGIERGWWTPGVTHLLDPFAGVALGGLAAAASGLAWTGVELEERFVSLGQQNINLHCADYERMGHPVPRIIQGDSRRLLEVLREHGIVVGASVTSPPFGEITASAGDPNYAWKFHGPQEYGTTPGQLGTMPEGAPPLGAITSPPFGDSRDEGTTTWMAQEKAAGRLRSGTGGDATQHKNADKSAGYGNTPGQIANFGGITSPPYGELDPSASHGQGTSRKDPKSKNYRPVAERDWREREIPREYGNAPGQIANLGGITSPPFSQPDTRDRYPVQEGSVSDAMTRAHTVDRQAQDPANIAALSGITSPPWENQEPSHAQRSGFQPAHDGTRRFVDSEYGKAVGQIGNTQGSTYWGAISLVLQQLYDLFPPGGVLCWIVKPFVRNKAIVNLPQMTLDLMLSQGWEPVTWIDAMLVAAGEQRSAWPEEVPHKRRQRKSFFRLLAERKGAPRIDAEVVLVVKRP